MAGLLGALKAVGMLGAGAAASVYSDDAEASRFTDALKAIDKFTAAHGTPNVFPPSPKNPLGEFDWSKMGTGEGAQAFTRGHYLAGDKNISRVHYRDRLVDRENASLDRLAGNNSYDAQIEKLHAAAIRQNLAGEKATLGKQLAVSPSTLNTIAKNLSTGKKDPVKELAKILDPKEHAKWVKRTMYARTGLRASTDDLSKHSPLFQEMYKRTLETPPEELYDPVNFDEFSGLVERTKRINEAYRGAEFRDKVREPSRRAALDARNKFLIDNGLPANDGVLDYASMPTSLQGEISAAMWSAEKQVIDSMWTDFKVANNMEQGIDPGDYYIAKDLQDRLKKVAVYRAVVPKQSALQQLRDTVDTSKLVPYVAPDYKRGALYTVEVGASPSKLLPLDMRMNELKVDLPEVYDALAKTYAEMPNNSKDLSEYTTPYAMWDRLPSDVATQDAFSKGMDSRGVPGAMFLSQGSRRLNTNYDFDPTKFNYVMYNDETPTIVGRELGKERGLK